MLWMAEQCLDVLTIDKMLSNLGPRPDADVIDASKSQYTSHLWAVQSNSKDTHNQLNALVMLNNKLPSVDFNISIATPEAHTFH